MSEPQPLPADSRRQADAMLAACDYQVWQTVGPGKIFSGEDMLFIEGAEILTLLVVVKVKLLKLKPPQIRFL